MGHVNNAVYFTYFEQARFKHWRSLWNFGEEQFPGPGVILARAECDYRSPARYGEVLEVRLSVSHLGKTSFMYDYEIVSVDDGRTIATGKSVQVMFDYDKRAPVPIPADIRALLVKSRTQSTQGMHEDHKT